MKKVSKSQLIREALAKGGKPADIAKQLKVPIQSVYTMNWVMKKGKKSKKVKTPKIPKTVTVTASKAAPKLDDDSVAEFIRDEISWIDSQIDQLRTIRAFLAIRESQYKQNGNE